MNTTRPILVRFLHRNPTGIQSAAPRRSARVRDPQPILAVSLLFIGFLTHCLTSHAAVVQDFFTRTGALNGSLPDTGSAWVANSNIFTNGTTAQLTGQYQAFIPFTPAAGNIYTLSVSVTINPGSGNWVAFGFGSRSAPDLGSWQNNNPYAWMLVNGTSYAPQAFQGPGTATPRTVTGIAGSAGIYTITLNTATFPWSYSYSGPGGTSATYTYTTNPSITHIGFGGNGTANFTIDNFTLTSAPTAIPLAQDGFSRSAVLNGSSPDVGSNWIANSNILTNGSSAQLAGQYQAFIPFTPVDGTIYDLSLSVTRNAGSGNWVAFGFGGRSTPDLGSWQSNNPYAWMLVNGTSYAPQAFEGPSTTTSRSVTGIAGAAGTYKIRLNTTTSPWSYSYTGPGGTSATYTYTTNPAITHIGFGGNGSANYTIDNFSLTAGNVIPTVISNDQQLIEQCLGYLSTQSSGSDPSYYANGVWYWQTSGSYQWSQPSSASACADLWTWRDLYTVSGTLGQGWLFQHALDTLVATGNQQNADGSFGTPGTPDTSFWATEFAHAYLTLAPALSAGQRSSFTNRLTAAVEFLISYGDLPNPSAPGWKATDGWYSNGNIELLECELLYLTWQATGNQRYKDLFETQWAHTLAPDQVQFPGFGRVYTLTGTRADGGDSKAYLGEKGATVGYDGDYTQLSLTVASRLYVASGDARVQRLVNELLNTLLDHVNQTGADYTVNGGVLHPWYLDMSYGSRKHTDGFGCGPFDTPGLYVAAWLCNRPELKAKLEDQFNTAVIAAGNSLNNAQLNWGSPGVQRGYGNSLPVWLQVDAIVRP